LISDKYVNNAGRREKMQAWTGPDNPRKPERVEIIYPVWQPFIFHRGDSMMRKLVWFLFIFLAGCVGIPDHVTPVKGFDVQRYLGLWYEIARLDHSFERGLEKITAHYSLAADGSLRVINRGFNPTSSQWKEAVGKGSFIADADTGRLQVSFFWPFYGSYNIIALDQQHYSYALVCGPSRSYLWILAREPRMDASIKSELINKAKALGFETDKLIHVRH
jgi:apolipoprotein D and lipocalin family protein